MALMRQGARTLLHLINLSGHSQTGYFPPVPVSDIHVQITGSFRSVRNIRSTVDLQARTSQGYTEFTLPRLNDYELVILE
jgi:hypothetical protein